MADHPKQIALNSSHEPKHAALRVSGSPAVFAKREDDLALHIEESTLENQRAKSNDQQAAKVARSLQINLNKPAFFGGT